MIDVSRNLFGGIAIVAGAICIVAAVEPVRAESGTVVDLPMATVKMKNALAVHVDTRWVDANGYRPMRVKLTPVPAPTTADRTIRVEVFLNEHGGMRSSLVASQFIEIPQGSTGVEATIAVPQRHQAFHVNLEFSEDGRHLKDLDWQGTWFTGQWGWTEASPAVLFIDADTPLRPARDRQIASSKFGAKTNNAAAPTDVLPDVRVIADIVPTWPQVSLGTIDTTKKFGDGALLTLLESYPRLALLPFAELPVRMIDYSCFDVVVISRGDLQQLIANEPKKWWALRDWIATGASLCVYDAGDKFEHLAELEKLLALPALPDEKAGPRGWQTPESKHKSTKVTGIQLNALGYQQGVVIDPTTGKPMTPAAMQTAPAAEAEPKEAFFVSRPLGLGRVLAIGPADPFPGSAWQWGWLFNSIGAPNLAWYQRHGLSLNRENNDYWNFLIPGVGRPPVLTFLVLISLFMIVVGPVNYLTLRRRSRLYLLLVTVPGAAGFVTLSLLAYAVLSDGLGVRVRVRSFTQIDQTNGRSVSWSRQAYYAGVAPSGGLTFPTDTLVYPLEDFPPNQYSGQSRPTQKVEWGDNQNLTAGYIASRTTAQFVAIRTHATQAKLVVLPPIAGQISPRAENKLEASLNQLLLCDALGNLHWGEMIATEAIAQLTPIEPKDAQARFSAIVRKHQPTNDTGVDFVNDRRRRYVGWNYVDRNLPSPLSATSVMEIALQSYATNGILKLPPRSYVAITSLPPEVPLGVRKAKMEASFHIVTGQW